MKLAPADHRCLIGRRLARLRHRGGDESGQALVELALVLPILLLLVFAIIDFAHAYQQDNETTHLANIGARYATVGTVPDGSSSLCDYLENGPEAQAAGMKGNVGVTVTAPASIGSPLTVVVSTNYHWIPYIGDKLFGSTTATSPISSTATMRLENNAGSGMSCSIPTPT